MVLTQNSDKVADLHAKLSQAEGSLGQAKTLNNELRDSNTSLRGEIDKLKADKKKLQSDLERERSRADQALHSSNLSHNNQDAVRSLKSRVQDLESEIELLNQQNARLLSALKEANENSSAHQGGHRDHGSHRGQENYDLLTKIDNLTRKLEASESENRRLRGQNDVNEGKGGYNSGYSSRQDQIARLEAENESLKKSKVKFTSDMNNKELMNASDISNVQDENRRLKSELAAEKKILENRVLIAEEKAKALLDQYSSTVAPTEIKSALLRASFDDILPTRTAAPFIFDKPLTSTYSGDYNREPFRYDYARTRDVQNYDTRWEEPKYISSNVNLYRQEEPVRVISSREVSPIYRPSATPVYEVRERPTYYLDRSYAQSDYGVPKESFPAYSSLTHIQRPVLESELHRSRPTTKVYHEQARPRSRVHHRMGQSSISSGEDYLSRVSQVYATKENSLNTSADRASFRRKAVAESSPYRSRPGETFLSEFRHKLQSINL